MPICPRCGSPRIDRYCGRCGSLVAPPPTPASPLASPVTAPGRPRKGGLRAFLSLVLLVGGGLLMFAIFAVRSVGPAVMPALTETRIATVANPNVVANPADALWQLSRELAETSAANKTAVMTLEGRIVSLQGRQAALASQTKEMVNLRFTLEHALTQGDETGHWPVRAAARWFDRPGLQAALRRVNTYVRDQQDMDARISVTLAKLDLSMSSLREQASRLRDAETSLGYSQRNFSLGAGISTAELDSVRRIAANAAAVTAATTRNLPNSASFMLPAFDLDPPRDAE